MSHRFPRAPFSFSLDIFIPRMPSNEADGIEFTLLGSYLPQDAQKLLERLDRKGIAFRTRPTMPFPQPGPSTTLVISVDPARSNEANEILRDLFGDNLPNYDSSFFRSHR